MSMCIVLFGFSISLILMCLVPITERKITSGYRMEKYSLSEYQRNTVYMAFLRRPLAINVIHKIMLFGILVIPSLLMWIYLDILYIFPTFILLAILYRHSFKGLKQHIVHWERSWITKLIQGVRNHVQTWVKRGAGSPDELLAKRLVFLKSSKPGSPQLTTTEIDAILLELSYGNDEIGLAAKKQMEL